MCLEIVEHVGESALFAWENVSLFLKIQDGLRMSFFLHSFPEDQNTGFDCLFNAIGLAIFSCSGCS
jgi:hypothetical protein